MKNTGRLTVILAELENLYVGFIHNPVVDVRNFFVDWLNGVAERHVEAKQPPKAINISVYDDGNRVIELDDQKYVVSPEEFEEVLSQVLKSLKNPEK